MKFVSILLLALMLFSASAFAEPMTIDLDTMTPAEIDNLIDMAKKEKEDATYFPSADYSTLSDSFEQLFESMYPSDAEFSYPFFGLSSTRAREMHMLSGDVSIKYSDKSRQTVDDVTAIFWKNADNSFNIAAFFSDDAIYYFDDDLYVKALPLVSQATAAKVSSLNQSSSQTPVVDETTIEGENTFTVEHDEAYYATQKYIWDFLEDKGYEVQTIVGTPNIGRYEDDDPDDMTEGWYAFVRRDGEWKEFVVMLFAGEVSSILPKQ